VRIKQESQMDAVAPQHNHRARRPYTVLEFAGLARLSRNAVYEMVRRGELPAVRFGAAIRLPADACDRLLSGETIGNDKAA